MGKAPFQLNWDLLVTLVMTYNYQMPYGIHCEQYFSVSSFFDVRIIKKNFCLRNSL